MTFNSLSVGLEQLKQESPAIADKPARKPAKNCSNSTCLQRCRWEYWRLAAVASEICEMPRNSLKIQTYEVQGHRSWCQSKAHMW